MKCFSLVLPCFLFSRDSRIFSIHVGIQLLPITFADNLKKFISLSNQICSQFASDTDGRSISPWGVGTVPMLGRAGNRKHMIHPSCTRVAATREP